MTPEEKEEKIDQLATCLCNKSEPLSTQDCYEQSKATNSLCAQTPKCRIEEKSCEQIDYVFSSIDQSVFLEACPGSGKTEVVGLKAAYEISEWKKQPGGIAVLTFTRNAASVITDRICQFQGSNAVEYPHFVGTIDSWLHSYIAHPFGYIQTGYVGKDSDHTIRLVDKEQTSGFLYAYKAKYALAKTGNPLSNHFNYDHEYDQWVFQSGKKPVDVKRQSSPLPHWMDKSLKDAKTKFLRAGFATYPDIENVCYDLAIQDDRFQQLLALRFPLLIVDECQDLSWIQIQILRQLHEKGAVLHLVGDPNQAIYEFKRVDPKVLKQFVGDKKKPFIKMPLSENFRSCQPIVDTCCKIVKYEYSDVKGCCATHEGPSLICLEYPKDNMGLLPQWFEGCIGSIPNIDSSEAAIVARGWSTVNKMRPGKDKVDKTQLQLAKAIYLWGQEGKQYISDAVELMGSFMAKSFFKNYGHNPQQQYRPDCIDSSIDWRLMISTILDQCTQNTELSNFDLDKNKWAKKVRENLWAAVRPALETQADLIGDNLPEYKMICAKFRAWTEKVEKEKKAEKGKTAPKSVLKAIHIGPKLFPKNRITTIHQVKGETLDALMLVSAPKNSGQGTGHWQKWVEGVPSEAARFAYVASSRPRHLLVWAIPQEGGKNKKNLERVMPEEIKDLGFKQFIPVSEWVASMGNP